MNRIEYNTRILLEARTAGKEDSSIGSKVVGVGADLWLGRNYKNKNRQYI